MDPFTGLMAIAPLAIEFLKERRHTREGGEELAFREWLERVAFPNLVADSGRILQALSASQKAHSEELRTQLSGQLDEIQATLRAMLDGQPRRPTFEARWAALGPQAHGQLRELLRQTSDGDYESAQLVFASACAAEVEESQRRLKESGLVSLHDYAGGRTMRLRPLGYLVTLAADDSVALRAKLVHVQEALRKGSAPVDKVVAMTHGRCSVAFVHALAEQWDRVGWVALQKLDQRSHSRVNKPAQAMADATEEQLMLKALTPFLSATDV